MENTERTCIDCGRPLKQLSKGRPALRCGECKRGRRRIKEREPVTCLDCGTTFAPPAHTGKPPVRCETCRTVHRRIEATKRGAAWRAANPERSKATQNKSNRKRLADPEHRRQKREEHMLRVYGLTMAAFDALLESQGGVCAICKGPRSGPGKRFHVDHCHTSNKVRGLLCGNCNTAIGLLRDDPVRAEAAAAYLRR